MKATSSTPQAPHLDLRGKLLTVVLISLVSAVVLFVFPRHDFFRSGIQLLLAILLGALVSYLGILAERRR